MRQTLEKLYNNIFDSKVFHAFWYTGPISIRNCKTDWFWSMEYNHHLPLARFWKLTKHLICKLSYRTIKLTGVLELWHNSSTSLSTELIGVKIDINWLCPSMCAHVCLCLLVCYWSCSLISASFPIWLLLLLHCRWQIPTHNACVNLTAYSS